MLNPPNRFIGLTLVRFVINEELELFRVVHDLKKKENGLKTPSDDRKVEYQNKASFCILGFCGMLHVTLNGESYLYRPHEPKTHQTSSLLYLFFASFFHMDSSCILLVLVAVLLIFLPCSSCLL